MIKFTFFIFLFVPLLTFSHDEHRYRDYEQTDRECVMETYRLSHMHQTVDFVLKQKEKYCSLTHGEYGIWQVLEKLNSLIDASDPDLDLPQPIHALQTAEAIRADEHPRWLIITGFIHDFGKILYSYGEPQWAVVGDTFPVGCAFSDKIVYSELFALNPDFKNPAYNTQYGIYQKGCGLSNVHMSWGHDEYLYHVIKKYLPPEAAYIIRFHSFYAWHNENDYAYLMDDYDRQMFEWVKLFNKYDLYSKCPQAPNVEQLKPYYQELIAEFFPETIAW